MRKQLLPLWAMLLCCILLLPACQKRTPRGAELPSAIPYDIKVGVACFSQPLTTSELIAGHIPENQGRVPTDALVKLDAALRADLAATKRLYTWLPDRAENPNHGYHDSGTPLALAQWVAYGKQYHIDMLVVPQILNWHERQGSSAGVTSSAHVRAEFFLLDLKNGRILRRSIFEEKQVGLVDNILGVGDFLKRKGSWVEAEVLAREAMAKAIKELGL